MTDGEAACPELPDLASVRQAELHAALQVLSVGNVPIIRLGIPDGRVREFLGPLAQALRSAISPHTTLVAPFENDGHPDHEATGCVARQIAQEGGIALAAYPIWAWHWATPPVFAARPIGRFPLSLEAQEAKRNAIQRHVSQLRDRPGGRVIPAHVLPYFHRSYEVFLL